MLVACPLLTINPEPNIGGVSCVIHPGAGWPPNLEWSKSFLKPPREQLLKHHRTTMMFRSSWPLLSNSHLISLDFSLFFLILCLSFISRAAFVSIISITTISAHSTVCCLLLYYIISYFPWIFLCSLCSLRGAKQWSRFYISYICILVVDVGIYYYVHNLHFSQINNHTRVAFSINNLLKIIDEIFSKA